MGQRTPRELIELYWDRVYNELEVELIREICGDPMIRHDAESVTSLSHDEQVERVERNRGLRPYFTHRVLHADDEYVTSVWNMVSRDGRDLALCGIEVFRAEGGRLTECWNSTYMPGHWGEAGDEFDASALAPPPLIDSPDAIDADWLQRALAASGDPGIQRIASLGGVRPVGHGTSGGAVRVTAGYNVGRVTSPTSVVCKLGRLPFAMDPDASPFVREAKAYAFFGPTAPFRIPRVYFAASDDTGLANLVLEDLTATATPGDQIAGCSIEEGRAVVRELAVLHETYWKSPALDRLAWLADMRAMAPVYLAGARALREWLGDRISPDAFPIIDGFGRLLEPWFDATPAHRTLLHGDPRVDNVLFERTAEGGQRACLIDWQLATCGDPQYDVAYFLSGSLSPDDRRACERELVAEHAGAIAAVDPSYRVDAALESYRFHIVAGLWLTGVAAAAIPRSDHNAALLTALAERNTAAIRDWDGLAAIEARA